MAANFQNLNETVTALAAQVNGMGSVVDGVVALVAGQKDATAAAVTAALQADDAADQGSIDVAVAAVNDVGSAYGAQAQKLSDALIANTPPPNPEAQRRR